MGSPNAVWPAWKRTLSMGESLGTVGVTIWALRSNGGIISGSLLEPPPPPVPLGPPGVSNGSGTRSRTGTLCFVLNGPYITRIETGWLLGRTVKCSVVTVDGSAKLSSSFRSNSSEVEDDVEDEVMEDGRTGGRMKNPPSFGSKCISMHSVTGGRLRQQANNIKINKIFNIWSQFFY